MKCKIFRDSGFDELEAKINKWLSKNDEDIDMVDIKQSSSDKETTISIWYTPKILKGH